MMHLVLEDSYEAGLAEWCMVLGPLDESPGSLTDSAESGRHRFGVLSILVVFNRVAECKIPLCGMELVFVQLESQSGMDPNGSPNAL